jgi:hypothetical protein
VVQRRDARDDGIGTSDSWIVEQCSAFLNGTYRELLEGRRQSVPAWALINAIAHGDCEEVRRRAAAPAGEDDIDAYVARLARHALVKMRTEGVTLKEVQNSILVPLELALVSSIGSATAGQMTLSRAVARELLHGLEPIAARGKGS